MSKTFPNLDSVIHDFERKKIQRESWVTLKPGESHTFNPPLEFDEKLFIKNDYSGNHSGNPIAKVILNEIVPRLKKKNLDIKDSPVSPEQVAALVELKEQGKIDHKTLRQVLDILFQ